MRHFRLKVANGDVRLVQRPLGTFSRRRFGSDSLPGNVQLVVAGTATCLVVTVNDSDWDFAITNESTPRWLRADCQGSRLVTRGLNRCVAPQPQRLPHLRLSRAQVGVVRLGIGHFFSGSTRIAFLNVWDRQRCILLACSG